MTDSGTKSTTSSEFTVRQAVHGDHADVASFTTDTWPDRSGEDWVGDVFPDWVESDGVDQRTFVATAENGPGERGVVGIVQALRLSETEAWYQGMRVHPNYRGRGVASTLNGHCFRWSRSWGATVGRLMVFSSNDAGLGAARANGFQPTTEFRWLHPTPTTDPKTLDEIQSIGDSDSSTVRVTTDPADAFNFWMSSDAHRHLNGLTLDLNESWTCSILTRQNLVTAADTSTVLAIRRRGRPTSGAGVRAMSFRVRILDHGDSRIAVYGVAAWDSLDALARLIRAVAKDAASINVDRTRILVPETSRHVTDAARLGIEIGDEPDFVLSADLSGMNQ